MFSKILVAIDDSTLDRSVFEQAIALAQKFNAEVMLVRVISPEMLSKISTEINVPYAYPLLNEQILNRYHCERQAAEKFGLHLLRNLEADAEEQGVSVEFTQSFGDPGQVLCALAKNWEADLILIGRRGRTGLGELFLGSVSNYVVHHAPCSVLTVQKAEANRSSVQKLQEVQVV